MLEPAAGDVAARMARDGIGPKKQDIGHQNDVAQTETEARRRMESHYRVIGVDQRDDRREVEEVPMAVLDDQRKTGLAGVVSTRFCYRARGRRLPHRPVISLAVVVAGDAEAEQKR